MGVAEGFVSFGDRMRSHAASMPHKRAIVCDDRAIDYGDWYVQAQAVAGRLQAAGYVEGGKRRVGILSANNIDFAIVLLGCQIAGIAVVPLPGLVTTEALARMLCDANVGTLFYDLDHAEAATAGHEIELVAIGPAAASPGSLLDDWLADAPPSRPVAIQPHWASDFIYSSGTTGTPKGIVQSYAARVSQSVSLASIGVDADVGLLNTVGLYSNFGMAGFTLACWWGGTFFSMSRFSADVCVRTLSFEAITVAWVAPATLLRITDHPGLADAVAGRACVKLCAGAPLGVAQKRQVLDAWPGPFYDLYGQTETGTITLLAIHASPLDKLASVGTLLPTVRIHIIDETGAELPPGGEGEIAAHTTTMMTGYHDRDDAEASAYWTDGAGRTFIRTGDIGRLDDDGYLWLCDRKKDMIISGGYNVFPADIEQAFQDHQSVFEVAVVGYPSRKWGETPIAFLTLRSGETANAEQLRDWINLRVAPIQRVAGVKILSSLPNGSLGKILKRELREQYADEFGTLP